jgi:prepilin-type processing-associated H-X9-DG protein
MGFLLTRNNFGNDNTANPLGATGRTIGRGGSGRQNPPPSYAVKVSQVGDASRKVFIADGARFSNATTFPDADISAWGGNGGAFCDQGAPFKFTQSWNRANAPGNGGATAIDPRVYAFRHGSVVRNSRPDVFKMNCGFFDGHVELLGDLEASNPSLWWPKGTELQIDGAQIWADAWAKYFNSVPYPPGVGTLFIVP